MKTKPDIIEKAKIDFIKCFKEKSLDKQIEVTELPDEKIKNIISVFFDKTTFQEAIDYFYDVLHENVRGRDEKIDWSLDYELVQETDEYKRWNRYSDIYYIWVSSQDKVGLENIWTAVNGKTHSEEEAAKIAADKWCELLFDWHLQDNGALDENHGGGFPLCALGTYLSEKSKENITEGMKEKAHKLLMEYYSRLIHFEYTYDPKEVEWLWRTLPDESGRYDWKYGFDTNMYCDYDPCWALYLILFNAGISESDIRSIIPWKTGISIRVPDNAVIYQTYHKRETL